MLPRVGRLRVTYARFSANNSWANQKRAKKNNKHTASWELNEFISQVPFLKSCCCVRVCFLGEIWVCFFLFDSRRSPRNVEARRLSYNSFQFAHGQSSLCFLEKLSSRLDHT